MLDADWISKIRIARKQERFSEVWDKLYEIHSLPRLVNSVAHYKNFFRVVWEEVMLNFG